MKRAISKRLQELVEAMERDGYMIRVSRTGTGFFVGFPQGSPPEVCGLMRLNDARCSDPEINAALLPWLKRHRPYAPPIQQVTNT